MDEIIFKQFQRHIKAGDKASARKLISQYVKDNPNDADGWYLAATVAGKEQRVNLLKKALAVDPFHEKSHQALVRLQSESSPPPVIKPNKTPSRSKSRRYLIAIIFIVLIAGGVILATRLQDKSPEDTSLGTRGNPFKYDPILGVTIGEIPDGELDIYFILRGGDPDYNITKYMRELERGHEWLLVWVNAHCNQEAIDCVYAYDDFQIMDGDGKRYISEILAEEINFFEFSSLRHGYEGTIAFMIPHTLPLDRILLVYTSPINNKSYFFEIGE